MAQDRGEKPEEPTEGLKESAGQGQGADSEAAEGGEVPAQGAEAEAGEDAEEDFSKPYEDWLEEGIRAADEGRFRHSVRAFSQAVRQRETDPEAHYNLGVLYGKLAAMQPRPTDSVEPIAADQVLIEVYAELAIFEFERTLDLDPKHVHALNNMATLYALLGERDLARDALERSLSLDPDQEEARRELSDLSAE